MNRMIFSRLILGVVVAGAMSMASAQTLKIATLSPDGSTWMAKMRAGAAEVKTRTEGRVEFKFYTGGTMGNDKAVLNKIRIGQLHGGAVTGGSLAESAPDIQAYSMPLKFKSFDEVDAVRSKMDKNLSAQLEKGGFVNFGFAEGGFAYAMSKKVPVSSIAELRQQRVWIPDNDKQSEEAMRVFRVTPVPLSLADVLPSLQTGIVDTVATSPIGAVALQWYTQVKYLTDIPLTYFVGTLVVDKKAFAKISPADQAIVRDVMGKVFAGLDKQNRADNISAYNVVLKQGIKPVKPSAAEMVEWEKMGALASSEIVKAGIVSKAAADQVDSALAAFRAGKK